MFNTGKSSFYGEQFSFGFTKYREIDYSNLALVLPGQGSLDFQQVTSEIRNIQECLEYFKKADAWALQAGIPAISQTPNLKFNSTSEEFLLKNLYLFTLTVGLFDFIKKSNRKIAALTSHSFGECSVLVCSGMLSFEDGLQVVKWREEVSPEPGKLGTLVAVSATIESLRDCLNIPGVSLANINSSEQIVLACSFEVLNTLKTMLKKSKIPAVELKTVSRPYHSDLMKSAGDQLKQKINAANFSVGKIETPFLSSVNQFFYEQGKQLDLSEIAELMALQLTNPVYFDQQITALNARKIYSFLELGFSEIYKGFIQNLLGHKEISVQSMRWLCKKSEDKAGRAWSFDVQNSPFLSVLRKYINKVTGYDVLDIQVHDQFQEDLRIDSIKKAEIVFKTLEELNLSIDESLRLAQLRSVGDIVDFLEGLKKKPLKAKVNKKREFQIYQTRWTDLPPLGSVAMPGGDCQIVDIFASDFVNRLNNILAAEQSEYCFLKLTRSFKGTDEILNFIEKIKESFRQFDAQVFNSGLGLLGRFEDEKDFDQLNAFLKSLAKENKLRYRSCLSNQEISLGVFVHYMNANPFVVDFKLEGKRWQAKNYPETFQGISMESDVSKSEKTVLIIGGHKGLGFELLRRGALNSNSTLIVVGRSANNDEVVSKNIQKLSKKYTQVIYFAGDARDSQFMESLFAQQKVDLVINSAGLEFSRKLTEKESEEISLELQTKVQIVDTLDKLRSQYRFQIVNFSSVAAEFGNGGQTVYSWASAYQAQNPEHTNIFWPPLEKVGMTENLGILMKLKEAGLGLLPIDQALGLFKKVVNQGSKGNYIFMSPSDRFLYDVELSIDLKLFQALGYLIDAPNSIFMKTFSRDTDRYVLDHVIEQIPVIPASYGLAAMLVLSGGYFKSYPSLRNFNIRNIMLMPDGEELKSFIHLDSQVNQKMKCTVLTQMEHFSSELQFEPELVQGQRTPEFFDLDLICDKFYSPECVDFGPKMQVLKTAHFNSQSKNIIGFAKPESFYFTGSSIVDLWMTSFEVAFQVMALKGILIGKGLCIPLSLDSVEVSRIPRGEIRFQVELSEAFVENDLLPMKGTISAFNEQNQLCFKMCNVMMSKIRHFNTIPIDSIAKDITI